MSLKYCYEAEFMNSMIFLTDQLQSWCTTKIPDDKLDCEEYYNEVVDHLDYEDNPRELNIARGILLVEIS